MDMDADNLDEMKEIDANKTESKVMSLVQKTIVPA